MKIRRLLLYWQWPVRVIICNGAWDYRQQMRTTWPKPLTFDAHKHVHLVEQAGYAMLTALLESDMTLAEICDKIELDPYHAERIIMGDRGKISLEVLAAWCWATGRDIRFTLHDRDRQWLSAPPMPN